MSIATEKLQEAQKFAMSIRPKVGGFPYLAEALRSAGITQNIWSLPSCQSIYITQFGNVVQQGPGLIETTSDVPEFDKEALIRALRTDQAGRSSFSEFLHSTWSAGVVSYVVNFEKREVAYYGTLGEVYIEEYPKVEINRL